MRLIFERSRKGRGLSILPPCDVPVKKVSMERESALKLPELSETEISRHYTELMKQTFGVNDGFYPLGSCTMKYNPKIDDEIALLDGFTKIHPLQPPQTVQGCLEVYALAEKYFSEITGMDHMTFQPAAGAHGEFTGLMLIKAYHEDRGDYHRTKIIIPDSAHGTNPASAAMAGFDVINIPSAEDGCVDINRLREVVDEQTAGLMLTNPNTVGIFDKNILEITEIVHQAGGLNYYDGANLNAIVGQVRPGDMGFDVIHLNLHKTFATPHGGGGPGSGPVGCKQFLGEYLPGKCVIKDPDGLYQWISMDKSIGDVRSFWGNFAVVVKALTYILTLGRDGITEVSKNAVLNANYVLAKLSDILKSPFGSRCMHEFVISMEHLKKENGVAALDFAKGLLDEGIHPPTMYFPLIVQEALMIEPTETESVEMLDQVIDIFHKVYQKAVNSPDELKNAPTETSVRRLDEVSAARRPRINYYFNK